MQSSTMTHTMSDILIDIAFICFFLVCIAYEYNHDRDWWLIGLAIALIIGFIVIAIIQYMEPTP